MLTKYFSEHQLGEGGRTHGRTVTEADIVNFAGLTGDWHSLHVNREYAERTRFGQRIAHGMLVLSLATGLIDNDPPYAAAFWGMENVRLRRPTFIGDTLHVEWEVTGLVDHDDDNGLVTYTLTVIKQDGKVVANADMKMLVIKSGGEQP